ncbi:MAG: serine acetyltransferase [Clostridiales bacterium]|nr:serine acetyltransferase [Clostridiales bacterium]
MSVREKITDYSKGDDLRLFWRLFSMQKRAKPGLLRDILAFFCCRSARRHGGYVGLAADIESLPSLPHGLHGVYISRYSAIGAGCRIYQNVTIGEIDRKAPRIGRNCLIGAGAVIVGGIEIGNSVNIGAGAVVFSDVPDSSTVVSQAPRVLQKKREGECEECLR